MSELVFEENFHGYKFEVYNDRPKFNIHHVVQVHGKKILEIEKIKPDVSEADGIITKFLEHPIAVKTADCLPIIVIGKKGAANLHAGWRGVHQKIVQGSELQKIEPHFFFIGPHIQEEHFEVQKEFKDNFPDSPHFSERDGRLTFNLAAEVSDQIRQSWPEAQIQISPLSTFGNSKFNSFRENGTKQRNWNILSIEE